MCAASHQIEEKSVLEASLGLSGLCLLYIITPIVNKPPSTLQL